MAPQSKISEKSSKNRKTARGGRAGCGNHPKPIFCGLGGPCGQNEAYTSLVRPFLIIFWFLWSSSIFVWIPRNRNFVDFRICDIAEGKLHTPGKLFFGQLFFWNCSFGPWVGEILVFRSFAWFKQFLQHFETRDLGF